MKTTTILQVNGKAHDLCRETWIMGIINATPDSFSDGGLFASPEEAVARGLEFVSQGADIIDVGGESSRPGSDPISAQEEKARILPVIHGLREKTSCLISIDTTKADVARAALEEGADIINDISAFRSDPGMLALAVERDVPVILMHMKGKPKTMQEKPFYENVVREIKEFFHERIETVTQAGLKKERIILDPGIGFGKRFEDNLTLLKHLDEFEELGRPILIGVSRKAFIGNILDLPVDERLEGTIAASLVGWMKGAHIIRVHDVEPMARAVKVARRILGDETCPHEKAVQRV